jgi:hypothetical protein
MRVARGDVVESIRTDTSTVSTSGAMNADVARSTVLEEEEEEEEEEEAGHQNE